MKFDLQSFTRAFVYSDDNEAWLLDPHEGPEYVRTSALNDTVILYAGTTHGLLYSLMIPEETHKTLDKDLVFRDFISVDGSWHVNYSYDGEKTSEAWIDEPVDKDYLSGAEKPVFYRNFEGVRQYQGRLELNQKLVHALDIYWLEEQSAYCKLDDQGDIIDVIKIWNLPSDKFGDNARLVTANRNIIDLYLGAAKMVYLQRFDFTRVKFGAFAGWHNQSRGENVGDEIAYNYGLQSNGSYSNGFHILKPLYDGAGVSRSIRSRWDEPNKQFVDFITLDWKNKQVASCSCDPSKTSNYFEPKNNKPFDVSPVFFRPEVLLRYKQNREKYTLGQRSISCRGGWYLKSYDLTEDGQVHAYLYDLAKLPYDEQLYWKAFNEPPKGPISDRAYKSDFLGEWDESYDPVREVRTTMEALDKRGSTWWSPRGAETIDAVHYALTDSVEEWGDALLTLDHAVIEGFSVKGLRDLLRNAHLEFEANWQSLRLLDRLLGREDSGPDAQEILQPLKDLHYLRNKVKGHKAGSERDRLVSEARLANGDLQGHFRKLVGRVHMSFEHISEVLE